MSGDEIESFDGTARFARIAYKDGSVFEGKSKKRARHGEGVLSLGDGSEYRGMWREDEFAAGSLAIAAYVFEGMFTDNLKDGAGCMRFTSCGLQICGTWKEGKLAGKAEILFPDKLLKMCCWFSEQSELERASVGKIKYEAQGDFPGTKPCQMDPYEQRYVEVRKSTIHNAGEGVFATRDLSVGVLACYYNGALVEHRVVDNRSWRYNANTISLDDDFCLDVPLAYSKTRQYCATLGHKVNSSQQGCNSEYIRAFHPFWGDIKAVRTTRAVLRGEELFTYYDYKDEPRPPLWFV